MVLVATGEEMIDASAELYTDIVSEPFRRCLESRGLSRAFSDWRTSHMASQYMMPEDTYFTERRTSDKVLSQSAKNLRAPQASKRYENIAAWKSDTSLIDDTVQNDLGTTKGSSWSLFDFEVSELDHNRNKENDCSVSSTQNHEFQLYLSQKQLYEDVSSHHASRQLPPVAKPTTKPKRRKRYYENWETIQKVINMDPQCPIYRSKSAPVSAYMVVQQRRDGAKRSKKGKKSGKAKVEKSSVVMEDIVENGNDGSESEKENDGEGNKEERKQEHISSSSNCVYLLQTPPPDR